MDVRGLHREFKVFLDKVDTESLPDFNSVEIDIFLNEAQHKYITALHSERGMRITPERKAYIDTILTSLLVKAELETENSQVELPSDYFTHLPSTVVIDGKERPLSLYNIFDGEVPNSLEDPFNTPTLSSPSITFLGGKAELLGQLDGIVKLVYIRYPGIISYTSNNTCELPSICHRDIVRVAVNIALETIESQRTQTHKPQ